MKDTIIVPVTKAGMQLAEILSRELSETVTVRHRDLQEGQLEQFRNIIFIGAMGICVRAIAPIVHDKHTDPAVVCVDSTGRYAVSVLSGHIGGANDLCRRVAAITGAEPVVTTQSDVTGLWALDTLASRFGWTAETDSAGMNPAIFSFVNGRPTALLVDVNDEGTRYLLSTLPEHVKVVRTVEEAKGMGLLIAVTYRNYSFAGRILYYRPRVLSIGMGCRKDCSPEGVVGFIENALAENGLSPLSIKNLATIELKKDEKLFAELTRHWQVPGMVYEATQLQDIEVPNPSEKVREVTGVWGVAESCAIAASEGGDLVMDKTKGKLSEDNDFTFAVAVDSSALRGGHIEIVGAGPGDPELVSVRGKRFLEEADLILYAGSLVPVELTHYAKPGCTVRSSASMALEEQFALMKEFYDRGCLVVRLHTGDPCVYGAIQEQMAFFDRYGMSYHITPGISSFQAAAAALRSQFTIPEKVQSIILTRGEGRTPMPEKEKLHLLARSQSTMCIYLSAAIVDEVQKELLMSYPPETPVAACYKLTWKEEKIYRGQLKDLARIVHDNNLSLTTLLVVGDAIDNRNGLSKLYDRSFTHLFRK